MPDADKSFMPDGGGEDDWHWLDAITYHPLVTTGGQLPWAMEWIFDNIVQYLKDGNWDTAAELMGAICHFTGDATMPLHATYDYWLDGMHTTYETAVNNHIGEISIPDNYVPQELDSIFDAAMATLEESFSFTGDTEDDLSYWLRQGISWNPTIRDITENRVRAAVQFTANVWYTAMVQAGLVSLSSVDAMSYWENSIPFEITATAGASAQSVSLYSRYSTDNSSWGGWTFFENDYSSPYSWSFTAPRGDGYYEFYSIARKGDNMESPPAVADARCGVDRVAPASSVDTISPYWLTSTSFQITATASDATSGVKEISLYYRYSTDNSSWSAWALYGTDTVAPWMWSVVAPSGNGYYEFYSIARDKATNVESAPTEADTRCRIGTDGPPVENIRRVQVSISPNYRENVPGGTLRYTVTVTNTGNVTEDYNLSATDTRGWSLTLPSSVAYVAPGEGRQVTLIVGILATAENNTYDNITVTAKSSENMEVENSGSCTARCVTSVADVTSLTISPSRFALFPGYSGQVQSLTVTLRAGNNPLSNKTITWSVTAGSVSPSSGTTDALGQVSVVYTAPVVTAETSQVTITARFAGDAQYQTSSGTSLGIPAVPVIVNISASAGGTVVINVIEINVTVTILEVPQNALSENTAITVVQAPSEDLSGYKMVSHVFDIGPSGTTFATPSTLTLPYNENELPAGVSEDGLAIYRRTSAGGGWELVGGNVDKTANTISVQIDHLSEYAVMVSIGGGASEGGLPLLTIGGIIAVILIITIITIFIRRR
jgi:uncharacterized repeat protein (TIGR01451 family)